MRKGRNVAIEFVGTFQKNRMEILHGSMLSSVQKQGRKQW